MLVSGTASVDEKGDTIHVGDFRAQLWRTFRNITELLKAEDLTWHDIVRTTCYLRDIERDYGDFNDIRNRFYGWLALDPLPASTAIQARICRSELLVEIEAIAVQRKKSEGSR
ncbi:MAG: RidA family protein [Rhodothermales bacterium]